MGWKGEEGLPMRGGGGIGAALIVQPGLEN